MYKQEYYNEFFEKEQQKIKFNLYEIGLPENDPVHTLKKVLEVMNFEKLLKMCKPKGRRGYNPIMMYAIILYASMRGVRAVDKIVELCERDICFMYLCGGQTPKRDAFYSFKNDKLLIEVMEDLHYQFIKIMTSEDYLKLDKLFIDGTKIEANANRYTFVWRGSINYHVVNLLDKIRKIYKEYNNLIKTPGYKEKYGLEEAKMFITEGSEKVKKIIENNKKRKKNHQKKLSNNKILEIDNIGINQVIYLQSHLKKIAGDEEIAFVNGKGKRKSELQRIHESLEDYGIRLMKYKNHFEIMGEGRNSYSKTDTDATFMRMKDDHMVNGQLKAGYNVQFGIENYFIVHTSVSDDRTDYNTLIPLLEKHREVFENTLKEVTADSGYCKEENLDYLKQKRIYSYIKLQEHEMKKRRKYHQNIGKHYNMETREIVHNDGKIQRVYICHNNRELRFIRIETRKSQEYIREYEVYGCNDCSGCSFKPQCLYNYDEEKHKEKNKMMKINRKWENLKTESENNIHTEKGIRYRQIRSVQAEGSFGNMKENHDFRRFNYRGKEKVYKEVLLYVMGLNLMRYHRFKSGQLSSFEGKVA